MTADCTTAMDQVLESIRSALTAAQARSSSWSTDLGNWLADSANSQDAAKGVLRSAGDMLTKLEGPTYQQVLSGDISFDDWNARARIIWDLIRSVDSTLAEYGSLSSFWDGVVVQSAKDTVADVKAVIPHLEVGFILVVVAVLAVSAAVITWKVA